MEDKEESLITLKIKKKKICNLCNNASFTKLLLHKKFPLSEQSGRYQKNFPNYDLSLFECKKCGHFQLENILDPKIMYSNSFYNYKSKSSTSTLSSISVFIEFIAKNLHKKRYSDCVDIGGNDSLLLENLKIKNVNKYLIDPVAHSDSKKIKIFKKLLENINLNIKCNTPDIILCRHTLEHVEDTKVFLKKLYSETSNDCIYFFEVPSLDLMLQKYRFDTIMHQHINYFHEDSIRNMLSINNFKLINLYNYHQGPCGGSIMFCFKKDITTTKKFKFKRNNDRLKKFKSNYIFFLKQMKLMENLINKSESKIYLFGASLMLSNLLYFLKINDKKIINLLDDDLNKHNKSYKNVKHRIKHPSKIKVEKNSSFLITSAESSRKIYNRLQKFVPSKIFNLIIT